MTNLAGIYPPIPTPFREDGSVAFDRLTDNLRRWIDQPLDGVVMPGSNSEAAYLTVEERIAIWRICAEALRGAGKRLIAGTGVESTAQTIELTVKAAELGAEAALVLPPIFYRSQLTHDVLVAHYRAVADASPVAMVGLATHRRTGTAAGEHRPDPRRGRRHGRVRGLAALAGVGRLGRFVALGRGGPGLRDSRRRVARRARSRAA